MSVKILSSIYIVTIERLVNFALTTKKNFVQPVMPLRKMRDDSIDSLSVMNVFVYYVYSKWYIQQYNIVINSDEKKK